MILNGKEVHILLTKTNTSYKVCRILLDGDNVISSDEGNFYYDFLSAPFETLEEAMALKTVKENEESLAGTKWVIIKNELSQKLCE